MIICDDDFYAEFDKVELLEDILSFLNVAKNKDVELLFVNDETMREINLAQRNINKSTDVLSFPLEQVVPNLMLGSIVINLDLAKLKAEELGHSIEDEIVLLFTHALLHLLGFDHEIDDGQMREKEACVIAKFKLPKSLIIRTQENE